jgi:hypothetical protein
VANQFIDGSCCSNSAADDFVPGMKQEAAMMDLGGRSEARMDVEVNDYRPPGANNDHEPMTQVTVTQWFERSWTQ